MNRVQANPVLGTPVRGQVSHPSPWPSTPFSDHLCLHELFERQAANAPDRVAVVFASETVTYAELNARANRLAHHLRARGVRPDDLVGLCIERSVEMIVGVLGILKAGGAYVPLDPAYPIERLSYMLEDSGASILVRSGAGAPWPGREHLITVCLDDAAVAQEPDTNPLPASEPGNLAYAIYTSGSTGRPKGVEVLHRGIVNFIESMAREPGITPEDRLLAVTTLSFDIAGLELFLPLVRGARVVLARREDAADGSRLAALIQSSGATILQATPATWRLLLASGWTGASGLTALCGGEAMTRELADALLTRCSALWNMYGPTETTVWSTVDRIAPGDSAITIGRPIANTSVYIVDDKLNPVAPGEPGELLIGGVGVARGYHDRPDLTAERFIADPFDDGGRLYRTGDLARWLGDGRIQCLGRLDHQVKIRGFRIELGEIESTLGELSSVRESVVIAREDAPGVKRLVAYVVPWDGPRPTVARLREHILASLPDYMAPSSYVFLPQLPLTPNGKIDRKALPDPGHGRPELSVEYAPAGNTLERFLQHTFALTMGLDDVGIHDDFFELGGNSIQAAMIANRIQSEIDEHVYVAALFEAPTVARLAGYLAVSYTPAVSRCWPDAVPSGSDSVVPDPAGGRVGPDDVRILREVIGADATPQAPAPPRTNPPAVFVLAPPRSGSTLLRVMMAGHPALFAPPELELLSFDTLAQRADALVGPHAHWLEGTLRAVMELKSCDADEARNLVDDCARRGMSTQEFYALLQEWIGDRLLVDKTSTYCLELAALQRAEQTFRDARYIHLLRHPHAMIASFEEIRLDKIWFRHPHQFTTRRLAELVYIVCHQNILRFLEGVPPDRHQRLVFEDLVARPEPVMRSLAGFLNLPYDEAMLRPYEDRHAKMTDGIHAVSRMQGDPKFHQHKGIDAGVADRWKDKVKEDFLGDETWRIAGRLGYERPARPSAPRSEPASPSSHRLARIQPKGTRPPFFLVSRTATGVLSFGPVSARLGADQPFYGLGPPPDLPEERPPFIPAREVAARHIEQIRKVQAHGPYFLGGRCYGGAIALEMAHQLRAAGEQVALVALIGVGFPPGSRVAKDHGRQRLMHHLRRGHFGVIASSLYKRARRAILRRLGSAPARPPSDGPAEGQWITNGMMPGFRPAPYDGRVTLINNTDSILPAWREVATAGLTYHQVEGGHETMFQEPGAAEMAAALAEEFRLAGSAPKAP